MRSSHGLQGISTCLALTAVTRCLRILTPVPEMAGQSLRKRLGVIRHQNRGCAFLVIQAGPARLIPRIRRAVRLWSEWASGFRGIRCSDSTTLSVFTLIRPVLSVSDKSAVSD
jgi:hypothetical protein